MFHNFIESRYSLPSSAWDPIAESVFDHCEPDHLSFVIEDTQHTAPTTIPTPSTSVSHRSSLPHDVDRDALSSAIVAVALNHDDSREIDWSRWPPSMADTKRLYFIHLHTGDLRTDPSHPHHPPAPHSLPPPGHTLHIFILSSHCAYAGQRLSSHLALASYLHAQRLGYRHVYLEASHPATSHLMRKEPFRGVVTHRYCPGGYRVVGEDGKEVGRWEGMEDVIEEVHATIEQPAGSAR